MSLKDLKNWERVLDVDYVRPISDPKEVRYSQPFWEEDRRPRAYIEHGNLMELFIILGAEDIFWYENSLQESDSDLT